MRVLCAATSYPADREDWRGVFIRHMVDALARRSDIELSVWAPPGPLPDHVRYVPTPAEERTLSDLMAAGGIAHIMRSLRPSALLAPLKLLRSLHAAYRRETTTELYHLNWLQTALPLPRDGKPVLVTVLGTDLKLLKLPLVKPLLRRVMRNRKVAICPNAEWMQPILERTFGDVAHVQPVPFGIDPVWYAIERKLAPEQPVWLAVTRLTRDKLGPLLDWSEPLFNGQSRQLHLLGPMQEQIALPSWVHYHGPATPEQLAMDWFPKAHGLVTLSKHAEGRPQVMLEAMAAGLPIIASDMPAHASLVQQGVTGELCNDREAYTAGIQKLESTAVNKQCGASARHWVQAAVGTWDDCAERYLTLYNGLLGDFDA
ncbi:glycosyltransferase family 4 protein [Haliea sp.]|jgi:glycosyltransferase involved in cell wall biosynthesis|uniref:glycosyltransferase family 4 protein n=1 Tax=Haliea sp. TaxID=1932666 RepID=UPI000C469C69|nr:glycosyltransferase family 4 protein [Haliea sp.]HCD56502.1 group 1 glycosyl transferase [Halieaceae bacterium]MAD63275.1 group 1 glycosyl transferase [Haliea sp.]MAY94207.1 group 1 glycosyl transferase [Haliea sp.]MBK40048.1 group 1 glycosyl transferase [Haliea sp.]MBP70121.1 group 1 glycosyl transferase [Haliea sp.]